MRRVPAVVVVLGLLIAASGCGGEEPAAERPVQRPADPVRCPENVPAQDAWDARELLGMTTDAARERTEAEGCRFRVVERDGEQLAITMDLRPDRVNAVLRDGVVVAVSVG